MPLNVLSIVEDTGASQDLTGLAGAGGDWISWNGASQLTPTNRKSGVGILVDPTIYGSGSPTGFTNATRTTTCTDGTSPGSESLTAGIYNNALTINNGFVQVFPADTLRRYAYLLVELYSSRLTIVSSLSDASAGDQSDGVTMDGGGSVQKNYKITVEYYAASAGQTLTLSLYPNLIYGGAGAADICAAIVTVGTAVEFAGPWPAAGTLPPKKRRARLGSVSLDPREWV